MLIKAHVLAKQVQMLTKTRPTFDQTDPTVDQKNNFDRASPNNVQTSPNVDQTNPNADQTNPNIDQTNPTFDKQVKILIKTCLANLPSKPYANPPSLTRPGISISCSLGISPHSDFQNRSYTVELLPIHRSTSVHPSTSIHPSYPSIHIHACQPVVRPSTCINVRPSNGGAESWQTELRRVQRKARNLPFQV